MYKLLTWFFDEVHQPPRGVLPLSISEQRFFWEIKTINLICRTFKEETYLGAPFLPLPFVARVGLSTDDSLLAFFVRSVGRAVPRRVVRGSLSLACILVLTVVAFALRMQWCGG